MSDLNVFESIVTEIQAFASELGIDSDGNTGYMGVLSIAALCGVSKQALLDTRPNSFGLFARIRSGKNLPECLKPFAGFDYWRSGKVPDSLVAAIVYYYAIESRNPSKKAKQVLQLLVGKSIKDFIVAACAHYDKACSDISQGDNKRKARRFLTPEILKDFLYTNERAYTGAEIASHFDVSISTARDTANLLEVQGLIVKTKIKAPGQLVFTYHKPDLDIEAVQLAYTPARTVRIDDSAITPTPAITIDEHTPINTGSFAKDLLTLINQYELNSQLKLELLEAVIKYL
jgi:hypothetical protein